MSDAFLTPGQTAQDTGPVAGAPSSASVSVARVRQVLVRGVAGNDRLKAFSDGIFTITITLLVLGIRIPQPPTQLSEALVNDLLPEAVATVASFVLLGVYWVGHHNMFMHIKRHDRQLLWLNILFLIFVSFMPLLAGILVRYQEDQLAVLIYAGPLIAAGLSLDLIWLYSSRRGLVDPGISPELVKFVHRRVLMAPAIYLVAVALSFVSLLAAKLLFVVVALAYILPDPMDRHHHRELGGEDEV